MIIENNVKKKLYDIFFLNSFKDNLNAFIEDVYKRFDYADIYKINEISNDKEKFIITYLYLVKSIYKLRAILLDKFLLQKYHEKELKTWFLILFIFLINISKHLRKIMNINLSKEENHFVEELTSDLFNSLNFKNINSEKNNIFKENIKEFIKFYIAFRFSKLKLYYWITTKNIFDENKIKEIEYSYYTINKKYELLITILMRILRIIKIIEKIKIIDFYEYIFKNKNKDNYSYKKIFDDIIDMLVFYFYLEENQNYFSK